jgi:hypothetical protein
MTSIFIPEERAKLESQNKTQWAHWTAYHHYATKWRNALTLCLGRCSSPPDGKMKVTIASFRSRLLDQGNLVGGAKPIPDALKHLGWIKDDTPDLVDIAYSQSKTDRKKRGTEITIQPL